MNFEIKCDSVQETVLKSESMNEEGCFASVFYDSYENRLKRKVTQEITSAAATRPKKISFTKRMKLRHQLNSTIVLKVKEILVNENHRSHVTWAKEVTVIQEIYPEEEWKILKDYRYNWSRRDFERERMKIKMMIKEILSEIISSIV